MIRWSVSTCRASAAARTRRNLPLRPAAPPTRHPHGAVRVNPRVPPQPQARRLRPLQHRHPPGSLRNRLHRLGRAVQCHRSKEDQQPANYTGRLVVTTGCARPATRRRQHALQRQRACSSVFALAKEETAPASIKSKRSSTATKVWSN